MVNAKNKRLFTKQFISKKFMRSLRLVPAFAGMTSKNAKKNKFNKYARKYIKIIRN